MASYSQIRHTVKQSFGLADQQMRYVANQSDAATAILNYGEAVDYILNLPQEVNMGSGSTIQIDPNHSQRNALTGDFRNNMGSMFPESGIIWSCPVADSVFVAREIRSGSAIGKKFYEAFIRRQISSWTHPHLAKQPLKFLPGKYLNPNRITNFGKAEQQVTRVVLEPQPMAVTTTPLRALMHAPGGAE